MSSFVFRASASTALVVVLAACGDPVEPTPDTGPVTSGDAAFEDVFASVDAPPSDDAPVDLDAPVELDAPSDHDAPALVDDAFTASDAFASTDAFAAPDAFSAEDAPVTRRTLFAEFCPSTVTGAGLYRGTLASNLNDIAGACTVTAPGRDGTVRVMLAPGQTLTATYRHAGDGILYLLERCPVVGSCVASADSSSSGAETLRYTNTGSAAAPYSLVLDSDSTSGPQTFELDLEITP